MRNCLCIIMFLVLSLTIPATSAYAYGGGGDSGGDGEERATSPHQSSGPPPGFKAVGLGGFWQLRGWSGTKPSSKTDPGKGKKVRALVGDIKKAAKEGEVEGDSTDSAKGTTSDEKTKSEEQGDKKNISEDRTDKTGNITNGVRRFILQLHQLQSIPQGLHPTADAAFQAADRAERVERVNNFFHEAGFNPPDLSDNKKLVEVENLVKKAENNIAIHDDIKKNSAAVAECEKIREALLREREEQLERSCADVRAFVKFGMDATVTIATAGIGGVGGAGISIGYSAATSDDPVKGGAVQTMVEVVTPKIVKSFKPFRSRVLNNLTVNFGLAKTEEAAEYGLAEVLGRQQQRDQLGPQAGQSIDKGVQSVPSSK